MFKICTTPRKVYTMTDSLTDKFLPFITILQSFFETALKRIAKKIPGGSSTKGKVRVQKRIRICSESQGEMAGVSMANRGRAGRGRAGRSRASKGTAARVQGCWGC